MNVQQIAKKNKLEEMVVEIATLEEFDLGQGLGFSPGDFCPLTGGWFCLGEGKDFFLSLREVIRIIKNNSMVPAPKVRVYLNKEGEISFMKLDVWPLSEALAYLLR